MHDAFFVGRGQAVGSLCCVLNRLARRHWAAHQTVAQSASL